MLDRLLGDIRFALRWLRRSPGFTFVAVASFAVGIGFNTALFSVVDAVLFRPLPVREPDRLVDVFTTSNHDRYATSSYLDFLDLKSQNGVFEDMIGSSPLAALNLRDHSRLVMGEIITGNYFRMLGITASLGRTLTPADDRLDADRVVVVSEGFWGREMGADPNAIAIGAAPRKVQLVDGETATSHRSVPRPPYRPYACFPAASGQLVCPAGRSRRRRSQTPVMDLRSSSSGMLTRIAASASPAMRTR